LIAKCRKLYGAKTNEIVGQAVFHASKTIVQPEAKLRAPANEGELRNSIRVRLKVNGNKISSEIFTNSDHGVYVELGTGPKGQASHSGISPEVSVSYRSSPWYVHEDQIDVGKYHFQKMGEFYKMYGQPAQPYLYPALKDNQERVSNNISKYVSRKIKEQI
jgi:HK97 gp10 family phage protein